MDEYIKRDVFMKGIMEAKWMDGYDGAMAMEIAASAPAARRCAGDTWRLDTMI